MYVEFGNADALEGYRDPTSDDPDAVRYRALGGQRVTQIVFPEGMGLQESFSAAITALGYHMTEGSKPNWIESDSEGLVTLLQEHYGITPSKNIRPKAWGNDTGVAALPTPGTGEV